jgi:hypothetical protein
VIELEPSRFWVSDTVLFFWMTVGLDSDVSCLNHFSVPFGFPVLAVQVSVSVVPATSGPGFTLNVGFCGIANYVRREITNIIRIIYAKHAKACFHSPTPAV